MKERHAPSILALTRQSVPLLRTEAGGENRCARGAYVLAEADGARRAAIWKYSRTGSNPMILACGKWRCSNRSASPTLAPISTITRIGSAALRRTNLFIVENR